MKVSVIFSLLILFAAANLGAAVVFSDDFEGGPFGLNTVPANWMVSAGTVDSLHNYPGLACNSGAGCVDLDGSTGNAGVFASLNPLNLMGGVTYTLEYYLAGSHRGDTNTVNVSFGLVNQSHTLVSSAPYALFSLSFTPAANTTASIAFENLGGDNIGLLLDDVSVTSSAIPEPSTWVLMAAGSALLGVLKLRRR